MKEFYVQVLSNSSTTEFPNNVPQSFKNRLPYPLQFKEEGWKVGLTGMTYPTPPVRSIQTHFPFEKNDLICRFQWTMKSKDVRDNVVINYMTFALTGEDIIPDQSLITGGKALMKYIVNRYERKLREEMTDKGDSLLNGSPDFEKFYPVFRWEGEDLILDNSLTFLKETGQQKRHRVLFGTKLAEGMKWIYHEQAVLQTFYEMNGNLRPEADTIPDDVHRDWAHFDSHRTWSELWGYTNEGLQLSAYSDWRFTYLDEDYREAFGVHVTASVPHRTPMYVYSNVGRSIVTGTQVTDLLREVPHDSSLMSYEPAHTIYVPVRTDVMDIIEVELAENNGELVKFVGGGVTTITLHFKYE